MESLKIVGPVPIPHRIGGLYRDTDDNTMSILAQVEANEVCIICLKNGNRYSEAVRVKNTDDITSLEFKKIISGGNFIYVGRFE